MIGNRYPYRDTGYTILEEGTINRQTLALDVSHYLVVDRQGNTLPGQYTWDEAQARIESLLNPQK